MEREIAGFTLPYLAALAVTSFLSASFSCGQVHIFTCFILQVTTVAALGLMHPIHKKWDHITIMALMTITAAGCGCISALTSRLSGAEYWPCKGIISGTMTGIGLRMKAAIEAIPFADSTTNSLLSALITGDRTGIPDKVTTSFRDSGASHILALSGLHLGIIYGLLSKTLTFLGNSLTARKLKSVLIVISCGIYTLATGAGASITRAFIFIFLNEVAKITGRYRNTGSILLVAAFLQLTASPGSIHDIGFQLSYAAMAGIAFIFPGLRDLWPAEKNNPLRWIWNSVSMSIACQITTGPLAWLHFGTFPQYFLLTNLIALPLSGLIIPSAILATFLNAYGLCPEFIIRATERLTFILRECLDIIASL